MKWLIKEYFSFSKAEIRISILISFILLFAILLNVFGLKLMPVSTDSLSPNEKDEIDAFINSFELSQIESLENKRPYPDYKKNEVIELQLFPVEFDPNTADVMLLKEIGFPEKLINNLVRYRMAGGRFYSSNDLNKIYGMNKEIFKQVEAFIQIENTQSIDSSFMKSDSVKNISIIENIELNIVGITELTILKGVGEVLAERIVKYRSLLGGYVSEKQLLEVYGMNDSILQINKINFKIDTGEIKHLSLNNSSFKEFLRHPYLEMNDVKSVFELREYYKGELDVELLNQTKVLSDSTFGKILPYIEK